MIEVSNRAGNYIINNQNNLKIIKARTQKFGHTIKDKTI